MQLATLQKKEKCANTGVFISSEAICRQIRAD